MPPRMRAARTRRSAPECPREGTGMDADHPIEKGDDAVMEDASAGTSHHKLAVELSSMPMDEDDVMEEDK